ncbi:MAG: transposase [bacterium]|nr:transposase [bacterium]
MGYVHGIHRRQANLFPAMLDDYITEDNPVQFIDVFVDSLDLAALEFKYSLLASSGRPPYNPKDMLKLYIYGYLNRIRSSRRLEKESQRNIELMWLLKKLTPDHKTIANFRKDNKKAIKNVVGKFIAFCKKLDMFGGELISVDGSKFNLKSASSQWIS